MTDKVLGVVCLVAAGAMYTAEYVAYKVGRTWRYDPDLYINYFVVALSILSAWFLLAPVRKWIIDSYKEMRVGDAEEWERIHSEHEHS